MLPKDLDNSVQELNARGCRKMAVTVILTGDHLHVRHTSQDSISCDFLYSLSLTASPRMHPVQAIFRPSGHDFHKVLGWVLQLFAFSSTVTYEVVDNCFRIWADVPKVHRLSSLRKED